MLLCDFHTIKTEINARTESRRKRRCMCNKQLVNDGMKAKKSTPIA